MNRALGIVVGLAIAAAGAWLSAAEPWQGVRRDDADLGRRLLEVVAAPLTGGSDCVPPDRTQPVVVLALGQSNAGNHGADDVDMAGADKGPMLTLFVAGGCLDVTDPLPGSTGRQHSIWTQVDALMREDSTTRPTVWAVMGVDATSISDWTRASSPLRNRLGGVLRELKAAGLAPSLVLWQQGEADARLGTTAEVYVRRFETLLNDLRQAGIAAPVLVARSTWCPGTDGKAVRQAIDRLLASHSDVLPGPDTDVLQAAARKSGCHFSAAGLNAAAVLWVDSIRSALTGGLAHDH